MEYFVGVALALGVCLFTTLVGLARERGLFPTMAIIVASYYGLFALMAGSIEALLPEIIGIAAFVLMAVLGFRVNLWFAVGALAAHGVFDWFHDDLIANSGVPDWWPGFCLAFDVVAAAWLAGALLALRIAARGQDFAQHIRPHVDAELRMAQERKAEGDWAGAFGYLERAHVLGQGSTREHVRVHWHMLLWSRDQQCLGEMAGQVLRIVGAGLLTALGLVPEGNTGGADVSAFRRMAVPREQAEVITAARAHRP